MTDGVLVGEAAPIFRGLFEYRAVSLEDVDIAAKQGIGAWFSDSLGPVAVLNVALGPLLWVIAGPLLYWVLFLRQRIALSSRCLCRKCGYELRGLTAPRCSECGEKI